MTAHLRVCAVRRPFRRAAAALAAFAAVLLALGVTGGTELAVSGARSVPPPASVPSYSSDTRPYSDDAYVGARTALTRPERDVAERTVSVGEVLLTLAHTPPVTPQVAPPAPVAGHAQSAAAYVPADLGRAPPSASSI